MKDSISENTDSTESVNPSDKQDPLSDEARGEWLEQWCMDHLYGPSVADTWQEAARRARDLQDRICEEQQDWMHIELQEEVKRLREERDRAYQLIRELRQHCLSGPQEGEDLIATVTSSLGTWLLNADTRELLQEEIRQLKLEGCHEYAAELSAALKGKNGR